MANVKGTGVKAVMDFLEKKFGSGCLVQVREAMADEDRTWFDKPILPVSWVDFGFYMRMISTADRVLGRGDYRVIEDAARYNMRKNFSGVYKILVSVISPVFAFKKANMIWRKWFDSGTMITDFETDKHFFPRVEGFDGMPPLHEYNLTPSMDEIVKITGARQSETRHIKCVLKGDPACVWEVKWDS